MNAEVVAIRHVHFEDLGSFEQVLGERGRRVRYVDVGGSRVEVLDALEPSLLVGLGGPISQGSKRSARISGWHWSASTCVPHEKAWLRHAGVDAR